MRRPIMLTALFGVGAALVHFACDDTTAPPLPGSATGNAPATNTGGTNSNAGGTPSGTTGGSTASGGMSPANCGTMTGSGPIYERYGVLMVTRNGLQYVVQNNVWGNANATQTLQVNGTTFTVTQQTGNNSGAYEPVSYPSVFIGSNNGHTSAGSGLPRAVSSLPTINTSFSHNADGSIAGIYNAAYDVWFSTTSSGDLNAPSGGYLMVWLYDPTQKQPVGGMVLSGQTIAGVDGTWNIYTGTTGSPARPVISYVRTQNTTSMTFDLRAFISHAVANYPSNVSSGWYLSNVFGGFEIWSGGIGLEVTCFYASLG
jgi:hypothetical protein